VIVVQDKGGRGLSWDGFLVVKLFFLGDDGGWHGRGPMMGAGGSPGLGLLDEI
jgi:hypothetical protein